MKPPVDVVVTGVGVVSPIGIGLDQFAESLRGGRSGVTTIYPFADYDMPFHIGAPIPSFEGKKFIHPKQLKVMSREIQTAYAAAELALQQAAFVKGAVDPDRFGAVLGSEMLYGKMEELADAFRHCTNQGEFDFGQWGTQAMRDIFPLWMLKYLPNMAACHVGIAHDARGPNNTVMQGDASSLIALMEGVSYIQRDLADVVLVGGTGSRLSEAALPFRGMIDVSDERSNPTAVSRPFDASRTGMVNGEGSGVLVLESLSFAERRGGKILARIAGWASRTEPGHRREMTGLSIKNAISGALQRAELKASDIGHVNANGISTQHDDQIEAAAIRELLGDVPVTANKSYFGYLGAGAGGVELAATVLSLMEGEIPCTLNYESPDPACPVNVVHGEPLRGRAPVALKLNHTPLGQAAAVILTAA